MKELLEDLQQFEDSQDYQDFCRLNCLETGYTYPEYVVEKAAREARALGIECEEPKNPTVLEAQNFVAALVAQVEAHELEKLKTLTNLTVDQAAMLLQVSKDVIYDLCNSGELLHQKVGRLIRIKRSDLDRLSVEADW